MESNWRRGCDEPVERVGSVVDVDENGETSTSGNSELATVPFH